MTKLKRIKVENFKSIKSLDLELRDISVLIGANGAGKSNFVSLFKMLNFMTTESLQLFVNRAGGSNALLYYGAKTSPQMQVTLDFEGDYNRKWCYHIRLMDAAPDTLIFAEEKVTFQDISDRKQKSSLLDSGHKETMLNEAADKGNLTGKNVRNMLGKCRVFQFHDTSETSNIRKSGKIDDYKYLRSDAGNLASFLYMLKEKRIQNYNHIVSTVRLVAPHFGDFNLGPDEINNNIILLNWKEKGSDYSFGPHQLSDGLLRFMALTTLLLQPIDFLPSLIIIDEPELGLHPYAINILGSLIRKASNYCQIVLATQSEALVDQFEADNIIVVTREEGTSNFKRLEQEELTEWLDDYKLSELWDKNIIGGRPSR